MSNFLPNEGSRDPFVMDIEEGMDCLVQPSTDEIWRETGPTFGGPILPEVDTFKVANVLASDPHLVKKKLEELCGSLGVSEEVKVDNNCRGFNSVPILKCMLDAWVSKTSREKATICALVEILKPMNLNAVSGNLTRYWAATTHVVFHSTPEAFAIHRNPMHNISRQLPPRQIDPFMNSNQPNYSYPGQENYYPGILNKPLQHVLTNTNIAVNPVESTPQFPASGDGAGLSAMLSNTTIKNLFSEKVKMYWHNLPEQGQDEQIVAQIVHQSGIQGVADIVLKREEPKAGGWWRGVANLPWRKKNDKPKPLKIKMKAKKRTGKPLNRALLMKSIEKTVVCKAFNVKVTDKVDENIV